MKVFIDLCDEEILNIEAGGVLGDALKYGGATASAYGMYSACATALAAPAILTAPAIVPVGLIFGALSFGTVGIGSAVTGVIKVAQGLGLK